MRSRRSRLNRRKRVIVPEQWDYDTSPGHITDLTPSAPGGMVRLDHGQPRTFMICMTPDRFGTVGRAAWSTGAGTGTGSDPGWYIGIDYYGVSFAVEQSGGPRPPRVIARLFQPLENIEPHRPVCVIARWHADHTIDVSWNGHISEPVVVDGYGRPTTNDDSMIGGLRDFSEDFLVPGEYHRVAVLHDELTDQQVQVVAMHELARVGS